MPDSAFDQPGYISLITEEEREARVKIDADLCPVDGEPFFICAVLLITIREADGHLGFGVWVSQKRENFETYLDNYDSSEIGPYFGWHSNEFNYGGVPTTNLKTMAHFQGNGQRPLLELDESDHPLHLAQRDGISMDKAWEIKHEYLG
jgi:hypothetical protein